MTASSAATWSSTDPVTRFLQKPVDSKVPSMATLFFLMRQVLIEAVAAVCYSELLLPPGFTRRLEADASCSHKAKSLKLYRKLIGYIIPKKTKQNKGILPGIAKMERIP